MKKRLVVFAALFSFTSFCTMLPTEFQVQAKTKKIVYETTVQSASGKKYKLSLRSANVKKKRATDGDVWAGVNYNDLLYNGTFQFYINKRATSYKTKIEYNKTRGNFYKIPMKKGTPSLLALSDPQGTDANYIRFYYMYKGTLRKLNQDVWSTVKPKYVSKNVFKVANYDNGLAVTGFHIYYVKFNPKTGDSKVIKKSFKAGVKAW